MVTMYKDNPKFKFEQVFNGVSVYTCAKDTEYHTYRYIEALNWQTFSSCGITKDRLLAIADEQLRLCNEEQKNPALRTDIASLAQLIKYSIKYPVDEHCGLNMGCMLTFIEWEHEGNTYSEPSDKVDAFFTQKKIDLAMNNADAYAFFLGWGMSNIPEYRNQLDTLIASDYLSKRKQGMRMLLPDHLRHLTS